MYYIIVELDTKIGKRFNNHYLKSVNSQAFKYLKWAWIFFALVSFGIIVRLAVKANNEKIRLSAHSFFTEIVTTRAWNAMHGGVYVFADEDNPPNPYLKVPNRDIFTTDSAMLTLINPAYMTRQISELAEKNNNILYHITSNKPIRPLNAPDQWEAEALTSFEEGETQTFEKTEYRDKEYYRYMAPLIVDQTCMKCHAEQGYQIGDVRGGISVSIEAAPYLKQLRIELAAISVVNLFFLTIGLIGISYSQKVITKQFRLIRLKSQQLAQHKNQLTKSNTKLAELNSQKEKFLSIIAHDLRNPVGAIMNLSEILVEEIEEADTESKLAMLTKLHQSAVNTYNLMENLLTWSHSNQGKLDYNPENLVLSDEVKNVREVILQSAETKGVKCPTNLKNLEKIEIWADKKMLSVILRNLLSNAIKFTPEKGSITVTAKVSGKDHYAITVQDTGVGMPTEKIKNLFKIDKSISTPGTNGERGTGLGLILVKEFVEINKGTIEVQSQPGKGTSVTFTVPLAH